MLENLLKIGDGHCLSTHVGLSVYLSGVSRLTSQMRWKTGLVNSSSMERESVRVTYFLYLLLIQFILQTRCRLVWNNVLALLGENLWLR